MRFRIGAFAALALALLAVAGCGSSGTTSGNGVASKSAEEILKSAQAAAKSASSVHITGHMTAEGSPLVLDLKLQTNKGGTGKISIRGLSVEVIVLKDTVYMKGSAAFYEKLGGRAAAQLFKGKWLKAPSNSGELAELSSLTELGKLIDSLSEHGTLSKGSTSTIAGQQVIAVDDKSKGGTLYVATTGPAYPIQLSKTGSEAGALTFSDWNEPVTITAPSGAIDLSQLQAAGGH